MTISVLIAAYHAGSYLGKALESLAAQSDPDWELIVVEDGSRDGTEAIVGAFAGAVPQGVRYENMGENRGVAATRNRLLDLAEGDVVAFLDADDWWAPNHLSSLRTALEAGADFVVSGIQLFDLDAGCALESYQPPARLFDEPVRTLFETSAVMTSTSVALRSDLARRVGPFDVDLSIGEDRDYWMRCALAGGRFADTGRVTAYYAKHAGSTMAKTILWAQQEVAFYRKHAALEMVPGPERKARLAHCLLNVGRLLRRTDPVQSTKAIWEAWTLTPGRPFILLQLTLSASGAMAAAARLRATADARTALAL